MTDSVCVHAVVLAAVVSTSVCFMLAVLFNRIISENILKCDGTEGVSISFILCFILSVLMVYVLAKLYILLEEGSIWVHFVYLLIYFCSAWSQSFAISLACIS